MSETIYTHTVSVVIKDYEDLPPGISPDEAAERFTKYIDACARVWTVTNLNMAVDTEPQPHWTHDNVCR